MRAVRSWDASDSAVLGLCFSFLLCLIVLLSVTTIPFLYDMSHGNPKYYIKVQVKISSTLALYTWIENVMPCFVFSFCISLDTSRAKGL